MDARTSTAAGEGLAAARSGRRAVFVVRAADRFGNSVAAPPEAPVVPGFRAEITGSQVQVAAVSKMALSGSMVALTALYASGNTGFLAEIIGSRVRLERVKSYTHSRGTHELHNFLSSHVPIFSRNVHEAFLCERSQ